MMNKIQYRPDIDGLRAIAVLAVIIYHAKIQINNTFALNGGFLGVDVFFVISGFLITSILYQNKYLGFKDFLINFYLRRIRRIFPALLFLLIIITPLSGFFLHNFLLKTYAESGIASLFFFSNLYFWNTGEQYNAFSSLYNPLLHTWSLSVEEQFYLIFPFFFFFAYKIFQKKTLYLLVIFTLLSIMGSHKFGTTYASFNFYSLPSRFWEISLGCCLSFLNLSKNNFFEKYKGYNLSNFGLILIFFSFFYYSDTMIHPSLKTSLATIGTALIICFNNHRSFTYKFLSSKPLVYIGLISFSLYLWHYVIFSYFRSVYPGEVNLIYKLILICLTFIISIFSYHVIEKNFRNVKMISNKFLFISISISYIVLISFFVFYINNGSFLKEKKFLNINNDNEALRKVWIEKIEKNKITRFSNLDKINILIIGNSHARDMYNIFNLNKKLFQEYEFAIFDTLIECYLENIKNNYNDRCSYLYDKVDKNRLKKAYEFNINNADYVVLSAEWSFNDVLKLEDDVIPYLKNLNKKIILTSNSPKFFYEIKKPFTLLDLKLRNIKTENLTKTTIEEIEKLHYISVTDVILKLNDWLETISKRNNIKYLRKENFVCEKKRKRCEVITSNGNKIYWDNSHYTIEGAKHFGKIIYERKWLDLD